MAFYVHVLNIMNKENIKTNLLELATLDCLLKGKSQNKNIKRVIC